MKVYRIVLAGSFYPKVLATIRGKSPEAAVKRFRRLSGSSDNVIAI